MSSAANLLALAGRRTGHFRLESGYHTDQWFELDRLFSHPDALRPFVVNLARQLEPHRPEIICGPQTGGAKLAELIAHQLQLHAVSTERFAPPEPSATLFPVAYRVPSSQRTALRGRRVALVDDAISAGSAIRGSHADLLACGAQMVALGALIVFGDRAAAYAAEHRVPLERLVQLPFNLWSPGSCPLCENGASLSVVSDAP